MCPGGERHRGGFPAGRRGGQRHELSCPCGENANAALLVGVQPADFGDDHPLAGFVLQRSIEQAAFRLGGGGFRAPAQRVEDFLLRRTSTRFGDVTASYRPGVTPANLWDCLPEFIGART